MTRLLNRILPAVYIPEVPPPHPMEGDFAFAQAMEDSDDFLKKLREKSDLTKTARAIMADVLAQAHNMPFITTIYEAVQEMKSGTDQKPRPIPLANQLRKK